MTAFERRVRFWACRVSIVWAVLVLFAGYAPADNCYWQTGTANWSGTSVWGPH